MPTGPLLKPTVETHPSLLVAEHNMPCSVCMRESAVLDLPTGVFLPCWSCQIKGWRTARLPRWIRWFLDRRI